MCPTRHAGISGVTNGLRRPPPTSCQRAIDANRETAFRAESPSAFADDGPMQLRAHRRRVILSVCRTRLARRLTALASGRSRSTTRLGRSLLTNLFSSDRQSYAESVASMVGEATAARLPKCCVPTVEIEVGCTLLRKIRPSDEKLGSLNTPPASTARRHSGWSHRRSSPTTRRRRAEYIDSDTDVGANGFRRSPPTFCQHATSANRKTEFRAGSPSKLAADTDLGAKSGLLEYHAESVASWFRRYPTSTVQSAVYRKSESKWVAHSFPNLHLLRQSSVRLDTSPTPTSRLLSVQTHLRSSPTSRRGRADDIDSDTEVGANGLRRLPPTSCRHTAGADCKTALRADPSC